MLKLGTKHRFSSIKEFQIIEDKKIGCGSFGTVRLARHKNTCRTYAMKMINLREMPSETEIKLVEREIKLHSQLDHPHIIKLWDTMMDGDMVYMVMEYAELGNLFYHQNTRNIYGQAEAFKFFTQTLQGVHYLHSNDIIHRDLKPQNLLLDAHSNIKICDFGWCAQDIKAKRSTFCGTYEYMAPEMLFKSDYDYRVDVWALGILLYEMLHGHAPYKGKSASEVQQAMLRGSFTLGEHLSEGVKKLIRSILQFQPEQRPSIVEILKHPWIKEMENNLNSYLNQAKIIYPKDVHWKIKQMPAINIGRAKLSQSAKHRKNNSLDLQGSASNININLEINNFAFVKKNKTKNNYHSQEKENGLEEYSTFKDAFQTFQTANARKNKMDPVCKTQISEIQMYKMIQKMKTNKSKLNLKDPSFEREKKRQDTLQLNDTINKKKMKLRKSEVDLLAGQKQSIIRFNTEAGDQWDSSKLKKSHLKNKLMGKHKASNRILGIARQDL